MARKSRYYPSQRCLSATAPLVINHLGQFPAATISFNLAPGAFLGDAIAAIENAKQALSYHARRSQLSRCNPSL